MPFLAHEAGSGPWDAAIGLVAIAALFVIVGACKIIRRGVSAFVRWLFADIRPAR